ncbi:MAG: N-acetylmuramoyl-L-alanine amidase [Candidatus Omnitrophota bacterium]
MPILFFGILTGCAPRKVYVSNTGVIGYKTNGYFSSVDYVPLDSFCDHYGFTYKIDRVSKIAEIKCGVSVVKVVPNTDKALVNGTITRFSPPPRMEGDRMFIPPSLGEYLLKKVAKLEGTTPMAKALPAREKVSAKGATVRKVVIDPGHGGKDPGAIGWGGIREKDVVLDVARRLRDELYKDGGIDVVMTRNSDKFISLSQRSAIANNMKADLFVSIHANASRSKYVKGFEAYFLSNATDDNARAIAAAENEAVAYESDANSVDSPYLNATVWNMTLTENRDESRELASMICGKACGRLYGENRGIKSAGFYVLKGTHMPAVLVEIGFISNKDEARLLNSSSYRQTVAQGIAEGIVSYRDKFEKTEGFTKNVHNAR